MSEILATYQKHVRRQHVWVGLLIAVVLTGEMAFDIVERAIGRYLVWQNAGREKIGRSWEQAQQRGTAGVQLESVTRERRRQALELESISNFEELVQYVETNQQTMVPPSQFLQIYHQLPYFLQPLLFNPDSLVADARLQRVATVVVDGNRSRFNVVMLGSDHQTVRRASLSTEHMNLLINYGKERNLNVRSESRFSNYFLSAGEFWDLFESLHPLRRRQFIQEVPLLTESAGAITGVGISNQYANEFVEVAFAVSGIRAYVYYLPEDYVMDLLSPDREKAYEFYRLRRQAVFEKH
ncbi:MAG: hypothetical protein ONB46_04425 [candidate division KSB1 bacterium]|nr:hypothetical protein [candidate division KSB1 bacterium]MDZ7365134.1 hypothetical protein [candidate division KSB1 bacterium]MDZ7404344.1 hypothetical protein [candidate division KSB1 bacterium]